MRTSAVFQDGPNVGIFGELDETIQARLSAAGRFESVGEETYLIVQGREHRTLILVVSGKLRVTCTAHGDTVTLAELGAGEIVGEMSVIDPKPASASVKVIDGPAALWLIDGDDFDRFVEEDVTAGYAVMRLLAKKLCYRLRHDAEKMLHREGTFRSHFLDMDY
jgi:CRP/FNR family cyclic AMP-dependent transcriptional regulator